MHKSLFSCTGEKNVRKDLLGSSFSKGNQPSHTELMQTRLLTSKRSTNPVFSYFSYLKNLVWLQADGFWSGLRKSSPPKLCNYLVTGKWEWLTGKINFLCADEQWLSLETKGSSVNSSNIRNMATGLPPAPKVSIDCVSLLAWGERPIPNPPTSVFISLIWGSLKRGKGRLKSPRGDQKRRSGKGLGFHAVWQAQIATWSVC